MIHQMPLLPYAPDALEPVISRQTIDCHYGKHLQTYVNNLNKFIDGTPFSRLDNLCDIVASAPDGPIYNNAGQVANHTLYFLQFTPHPDRTRPEGDLAKAIRRDFGTFEQMQHEMTQAAITLFGSGWSYLVADKQGHLSITTEANGGHPFRAGLRPLFCFDVWEHAYYLDYQNRRADHINALWDILNWDYIEQRYGR